MSAAQHGHGHGHGHQEFDADTVMDAAWWDERYRTADAIWSGRPNPHLVSDTAGLSPGTALDIGCGEGADALWLAQQGWRVTAVDISAVALDRAAALTGRADPEAAARITWLRADIGEWVPTPRSFDLVSAQFMHLPPGQRETLWRGLAESVAPGGWLLIVGHHPSDLETVARRPPLPDLMYTQSEVAAVLDGAEWQVVVNEARPRPYTDPDGTTATIHDAVVRATRTTG